MRMVLINPCFRGNKITCSQYPVVVIKIPEGRKGIGMVKTGVQHGNMNSSAPVSKGMKRVAFMKVDLRICNPVVCLAQGRYRTGN